MVIATAFGWGNVASIALSVALAFPLGYSFTLGTVLRANVPFRRAATLTLASDTLSIVTMEIIDNAFILVVPGAIDAGLDDALFWWSLGVSLLVAFVAAFPVNHWLIARGRGHAVVRSCTRTRRTAARTRTTPSLDRCDLVRPQVVYMDNAHSEESKNPLICGGFEESTSRLVSYAAGPLEAALATTSARHPQQIGGVTDV